MIRAVDRPSTQEVDAVIIQKFLKQKEVYFNTAGKHQELDLFSQNNNEESDSMTNLNTLRQLRHHHTDFKDSKSMKVILTSSVSSSSLHQGGHEITTRVEHKSEINL